MSRLQELINELCPDGVEYFTLGIISNIKRGERITKKNLLDDGDFPVFSGGTKAMGRTNQFNRTSNTITISSYGAAGYVGFVEEDFWANDVCLCVYPNSQILINKYLYYYLKNVQGYLYANTTKAIPDHIPTKFLEALEIPVPPLPVQEEIVRILDTFTELTTELTTELNLRRNQYNYYSSKFFSNYEDQSKEMGELASFVYGYTDKAQDSGDVRFIRITDIDDNGYLKKSDPKFITLNYEAKKSLLSEGDLVMARTGATYGKTLYYQNKYPSVYASFLIKISPNNSKLLNRYYWHFTKSRLYWDQANKLVTTGGQPQFNTPAIKKVKIPLPNLNEQLKIVNLLDKFDIVINDISSGLPAEIELRQKQYEYYRDKLLTFKRKD